MSNACVCTFSTSKHFSRVFLGVRFGYALCSLYVHSYTFMNSWYILYSEGKLFCFKILKPSLLMVNVLVGGYCYGEAIVS